MKTSVSIHSKSLFFLSLLFLWVAFPTSVFALPSYTVSPLVITEEVEARDILTHTITLTNTGTQPVTLYPTVNNISLDDGGKMQEFLPPVRSDRTTSLASWIEISRSGIKLPIGESKEVTLTLRINPNPKPGTYHAFIGFGSGRNRDIAEKQVALGKAPGLVVTVTVTEDKTEFLKIGGFIVDRFVVSEDNSGATYMVRNPGDVDLVPSGEVIFYNGRGHEVGSSTVNPERNVLKAGSEATYSMSIPTEGLFGKYKALLSVEYGVAQVASVQDTAFFYIFPLKIMLILGGIVLVLVLLIALYVHKRYLEETVEYDSDFVPVYVKETTSDPLDHDVDLKSKDNDER